MADFSTLKSEIAAVIKANGVQSITGANFQQQLFNLIDTMDAAKVDAVSGKGLSTNDLTTALVNLINSAIQPAGLASAIATAVADLVAKTDIVEATGSSTAKVMSQKATTDALSLKANAAEYVAKDDIVQVEGASGSKVMSQAIVTNRLAAKANASDVFTKAEVTTALSGKADTADVYDKTTTNSLLANKINVGDAYTTNEVDTKLAAKASTDSLDTEVAARIAADNTLTTAVAGKANTADVYTKAQQDAMEAAMQALIDRIARDFGRYATPTEQVLSVGVNGKYVDKDSANEVSNSSYAISNAISLAMGDILLVPSASAVAAACSVVSKQVTNTYDKVILYTYTYDENGRIATAKADYNSAVYTAHYESEESSTPDYWIYGAEHLASLPETYTTTESFYVPLVKQSVAGMPDTGYYVYLSDVAQDVVISAYTATINGGKVIKVGWGIFKNIASNFVGNDRQRVAAEAIAANAIAIRSMEEMLNAGVSRLKVDHLIVGRELSGLNVNSSFCLQGAGAPAKAVVPDNYDADTYGEWLGIPQFVGQEYLDTTANIFYKAKGVSAVSDWIRISNA